MEHRRTKIRRPQTGTPYTLQINKHKSVPKNFEFYATTIQKQKSTIKRNQKRMDQSKKQYRKIRKMEK